MGRSGSNTYTHRLAQKAEFNIAQAHASLFFPICHLHTSKPFNRRRIATYLGYIRVHTENRSVAEQQHRDHPKLTSHGTSLTRLSTSTRTLHLSTVASLSCHSADLRDLAQTACSEQIKETRRRSSQHSLSMPVEAQTSATSAMTLTATLSDVTGLANLLKSVSIQTHAVVIASSSGLEIITELNRTLQAHAYLYSHMFDAYHFQKPTRDARTGSSSQNRARRPPAKKRAKGKGQQDDTADLELSAGSSDLDDTQDATQDGRRKRQREVDDEDRNLRELNGTDDEPESVSFEVNLQTWISCLNIFGGVGPSRPHGASNGHPGHRPDPAGGGATSGGRGYARTRDGTVDPYGADRAGSVERGFDRNPFSSAAKATRMKLSYQGHGNPLVLELEQETNVLTRVSISTYEPSFLTDMIFDPRNMVAQVIVGSELLQSAFSEIDATCKKLSILMTSPHTSSAYDGSETDKNRPSSMLRFKAISDTGSSEMEFPASLSSADPTGVIEKFVALPGSSEQWYDFTLLSRTMTVLRSSIKTSLRMDEAGLISFQYMMPKYRRTAGASAAAGQAALEEEQDAFCEFLVRNLCTAQGFCLLSC